MSIVHIGIGSNLGSRQQNCLEAIKRLKQHGISVLKQSTMLESEPWGVKDQPFFINMAIEAETEFGPEELLLLLKNIESSMGREKTAHWGPRVIDLDILLYSDSILNMPNLQIPHPCMHEREFVLIPLAEIAGDVVHPVLLKKIAELADTIVKH